jgi:flagellar motility protein MotE (MotC chaperone)
MKESDDDTLWDLDKIREELKVARLTLREAQKKHKENRDKCLREALEKKEREVKEAEDPAKAKKAAAAIESVIRKHRTQESYNRIRQVTRPNSGGGLQRVDVPKRDDDGNVL